MSCDMVCKPKSEGGLGLKALLSWNHTCIIQHIWAILMQARCLWKCLDKGICLEREEFDANILHAKQQLELEEINETKALGIENENIQRYYLVSTLHPKTFNGGQMTILNRLPTKDGLLAWGWTVDDRCQLRFVRKETRNHIFF